MQGYKPLQTNDETSAVFNLIILFVLQAVNKTASADLGRSTCVLEIGEKGIKMVEKAKSGVGLLANPRMCRTSMCLRKIP